MIALVECQCLPGHRKKLVANTQDAPEGENRIGDPALRNIHHDVFDFAQILARGVADPDELDRREREGTFDRDRNSNL